MSPPFGESWFGRGSLGRGNHLGEALSALLDGELSMRRQEAARAHLAACPECAQELSEVGQARSWIRGLPLVDPPFGFYERMLRDPAPVATGAFAGLATLRRRAGLAALGAAAVAVTVLGVGSPSQPPVTPAVPRFVEAHAAGASVGADLLSKLAPAGIPVSFGR